MIKYILILALCLGLASCEKETPQITTGEISFVNSSAHPYSLHLNGALQANIYAGKFYDIKQAPAGSYSYKLTQLSGYILYPTILNGSFTLDPGKKAVVTFP